MSQLLVAQRALTVPGWAKDALWRNARAVPSLDLRFADNKSLVDAVTGASLITFTRASGGTFVGSDGVIQTAATDVPRFDHNPTTGESLGLLVEEQRTNLRLNSATYQPTSAGTPAAYTIDQVAPDGTTTGSRQTAATPRTFEDYTGIANALYTFSFYCRVTSGTAAFSIQLKNAASDTLITSDTSPVATTTWRRFTISGTTAGATPGARVEIVGVVPGFVFWGADLEPGAFPTSYIPTTTAAATRSADVASITGTAFSGWYRQDEGTVFAEALVQEHTVATFPRIFSLDDAANTSFIALVRANSSRRWDYSVFANGTAQAVGLNNGISPSAGAVCRGAVIYRANDFTGATQGVLMNADTSGSVPTVNALGIGMQSNAILQFNGHIRRLTYWPQALPSRLQSLTQ